MTLKSTSFRTYMMAEMWCSVCHKTITENLDKVKSEQAAVNILRQKGYRIGKFVVCPECRTKYHALLNDRTRL